MLGEMMDLKRYQVKKYPYEDQIYNNIDYWFEN